MRRCPTGYLSRPATRWFSANRTLEGLHLKSFAIIAVLGLAACQATVADQSTVQVAPQSGATQLATQADMTAVVGKRLVHDSPAQYVITGADGTLSGSWDGVRLAGNYEMKDGFFCRTLSAGPGGASPEDCQLFILEGNKIIGTRNRGKGSSFTYTVT